jgi:SnoaL-like domain
MTDPALPGDGAVRAGDRQRIRDLMLGYCRGVDRLDLELVRAAYHPGGIDHHTGFDGTVEEYVRWLEPKLRSFDGTMHLVANHLVEFDGARAVAETYGMAVHWGTPADDPGLNFTSGFRYVDLLECRAGRWGIVERHAVREWTHSDARVRMPAEAKGPAGSRTRSDPVYVQLARMRSAAPL